MEAETFFKQLPTPDQVRRELVEVNRRAAILRSVLRLAERERKRREAAQDASKEAAHAR